MKLILTEQQYKILETILDEVSIPLSTKIEKGGFIQVVYMVGDTEKSQTLEITELHGTGKYVSGVSKGGKFIINIGGSLDVDASTFTILKDGEYKEGSVDSNGKTTPGEIVGGSKMVVKNVTQLNISDASKNVVDIVNTKLGDEKNLDDDSEEDDNEEDLGNKEAEAKAREKRIYDLMMDDPILKKAFYHQPKLFGGLINYGKARGIGPAKALLNKYIGGYSAEFDDDKKKGGDKGKFKVGKMVKYIVGNTSVNITDGSQTFMLPSKHIFKARYNSQGELVGSEKMEGDKRIYKYQIEKLKNLKGDIYKGIINVEFKGKHSGVIDKKQDITFKIIKYETN